MLNESIPQPATTTHALEPALERLESARAAARERLQRQCPAGRPEWLRLESRWDDLQRRLGQVGAPHGMGQGIRELCWLLVEELAGAYTRFLREG